MFLRLLVSLLCLCSFTPFVEAQERPRPQIPLGAVWSMDIDQARQLSGLERGTDGSLRASSTVRSNTQTELLARWRGRRVSFFFTPGFGLYAIGMEMTPWTVEHSSTAADPEQQDLEQCAPIRLAVLRHYGSPRGFVESWESTSVLPLTNERRGVPPFTEARAIDWPYARNWLIWEGEETRLALGERFVWYVSLEGLTYREKMKQVGEKQNVAAQAREAQRRAQRREELNQAREAVGPRAQELESLF